METAVIAIILMKFWTERNFCIISDCRNLSVRLRTKWFWVRVQLQSLRIRFDKIDGFIRTRNGFIYLALFDCGWFDKSCDKIKYLIS